MGDAMRDALEAARGALDPARSALEAARGALLDLSTRNRMLALPRTERARGVLRIAGEDPAHVWGEWQAGRGFSFEAAGVADDAAPRPARGRARAAKAEGVTVADAADAAWRADAALRVALDPAQLSLRLRQMLLDARTAREESGVSALFLGLGVLHWLDARGTAREAPLAFLPVALERAGVSARFRLLPAPGEPVENLPLREMLHAERRLELPVFDAAAPLGWAAAVAPLLPEGWRLEEEAMALGLFAQGKFLMWRDLDPALHPGLLAHAPLRRLLDGAPVVAAPPPFPDDAAVDEAIPVERLDHVVPVDGSQALAAEAVRRGHELVIQGPPGTGKSQTIVNILAQAVLDGRTVLFVAEKAAALEVVKRRLDALGLGAAVLALHEESANKRAVLDEIRATLALPAPPRLDRDAVLQRLGELRGRLNRHAAAMGFHVSGMAAHEVAQRLALARAAGAAPPFAFAASEGGAPEGWAPARREALRGVAPLLAERCAAARGPWAGTRPLAALPDFAPLIRALAGAAGTVEEAAAREAAGEPPFPAAALEEARALLADHALVQAAREDARIAALDAPGVEEAAAVLAKPAGLFGFLDGGRRAAQAVLDRALRDGGALDALLAARAAMARIAASALPRGAAALRAGLDWHARFGAAPPAPVAALAAAREAAAALGIEAAGPFAALAERLAALAAEAEALPGWRAWLAALDEAPELAPLADALASGALAPEGAVEAFDRALLEGLWRAVVRAHPALAAFDGAAMDRLVESFKAADEARVRLARADAQAAHHARMAARRGDAANAAPSPHAAAAAPSPHAAAAAMSFLRGEFERRRGHVPIRTLLLRGAEVVRAAKPVFMMSPLAVAQHLASPHGALPGFPLFDLVVMDEASQIEPVDAFGAVARGRQLVVVGDDRQMPPTRFFQRVTENDEGEAAAEEGEVAARDVESILGLCNARGTARAMLRWHYRSRHESLIATSNREFYEERLLVLPSPRARSAALGLSLVRVEGRFGEGANPLEAQAVAEAVMRHARETPGETLGVAAFSVVQRDAILDAVEALRRASPDTEAFFAAHPHEPFFVKNLENVQGDERDAIMISVGYGRGADGKLAMRFGPLSTEGGERRLNVLITRAKRRCIVFSGIGAEEVDLARAGGRGVAALKAFLAFAASSDEAKAGTRADTPLAALLAPVVGTDAVAGLGTPTLQVDLALRGADGNFAWGIEADGADFSRLGCARDRHHGWAGALEGMGWRLAQTWSADWLERPREAQARLRARLGLEAPAEAAAPADPGLAAPYAEWAGTVPDGAGFAALAALIAQVVEAEAPVPEAVVLARIGAPPAAAAQALALAARLHGLRRDGPFWLGEGEPGWAPRDRRAAHPLLRRAAAVHAREVEAAARALLAARPATTEAEAAAGVARLLGLEAGSEAALAARLAMLAGSGALSFGG